MLQIGRVFAKVQVLLVKLCLQLVDDILLLHAVIFATLVQIILLILGTTLGRK